MRLAAFLLAGAVWAQPNPAALPNTFINTAYQTPSGATVNLGAGGNLQAALNAAAPGDQIVLQAGASWVGNYTLPAKACSPMVTLRTSALSSFPEGVRATPSQVMQMASIITSNVSPAITAAAGACGYQLVGLEITMQSGATGNFGLVVLGTGSESAPNLPTTIFIERSWIHGLAGLDCKRGVQMNGVSQAVVDSTITEIHTQGIDSQAIGGWAGPGPFKIVNNELQAGSEIVLFGGAIPSIAGTIPSDIEITNNHIERPPSWIGAGWVVKNLFELKNARRVLFDSNLCEYNWVDGQAGYAILFQGATQDSGDSAIVSDVTFTSNTIRHSASGMNMCGGCLVSPTAPPGSKTLRIYVYNNVFDDIGNMAYTAGMTLGINLQVLTDVENLTVNHNTFVNVTALDAVQLDGAASTSVWITSNIMGYGTYGFFGNGCGDSACAIAMYLPGSIISGNLFVTGTPDAGVPGNTFPPTWASIQFVNFNGGNGGDYHLTAMSPYIASGLGGSVPGAYATPSSSRISGAVRISGRVVIH